MRALNRAAEGRTTVVIAHRLSTVVDADVIYVLKHGKVIEAGDHMSLVSRPDSLYAKLWHRQHEADRKLMEQQRQKELERESQSDVEDNTDKKMK